MPKKHPELDNSILAYAKKPIPPRAPVVTLDERIQQKLAYLVDSALIRLHSADRPSAEAQATNSSAEVDCKILGTAENGNDRGLESNRIDSLEEHMKFHRSDWDRIDSTMRSIIIIAGLHDERLHRNEALVRTHKGSYQDLKAAIEGGLRMVQDGKFERCEEALA